MSPLAPRHNELRSARANNRSVGFGGDDERSPATLAEAGRGALRGIVGPMEGVALSICRRYDALDEDDPADDLAWPLVCDDDQVEKAETSAGRWLARRPSAGCMRTEERSVGGGVDGGMRGKGYDGEAGESVRAVGET